MTIAGRTRARTVAARLGVALRDARMHAGWTQSDTATRAGASQSRISDLERGLGQGASLEVWACVAAAVGEQFVGFLEHAPGATPPRDIEHLRRQSALIEFAAAGGWTALPEFAIDRGAPRSRSIDVALIRPATHEAIAAEIWDWFDDVGASLRGLDAKVDALAGHLEEKAGSLRRPNGGAVRGGLDTSATVRGGLDTSATVRGGLDTSATVRGGRDSSATLDAGTATDPWCVRGLFVVRDTRRNRALVAELRPLFAARFSGSSTAWLRAIASERSSLPDGHGLIWSDRRGGLTASRLGKATPPAAR